MSIIDVLDVPEPKGKTSPIHKIKPRRITVLGATGSVGESTLSLVRHAKATGEAEIEVAALTAKSSVDALAKLAIEFHVPFIAIADESKLSELKERLAGHNVEIGAGRAGLIEAAQRDADWVMAAIVGAAGLEATLAAARRGADVAIANKECLVSAGALFTAAIQKGGGSLLPVDSEHNAIFQVYDFERPHRITKLILTASGGPFRDWSLEAMTGVTPEQAVAHPNWSMGAKISVDSATMMNKGLELIEAAWIFPTPHEDIEILVHPQSVIHSMVEYVDGSTLAQLGTPDMRTPIASTLAWPDRVASPSPKLDLTAISELSFEKPDEIRFPALKLAREALQTGQAATCVLNAANEVAVAAFLKGHLKFLDIANVTAHCLSEQTGWDSDSAELGSLEDVVDIDSRARQQAENEIKRIIV